MDFLLDPPPQYGYQQSDFQQPGGYPQAGIQQSGYPQPGYPSTGYPPQYPQSNPGYPSAGGYPPQVPQSMYPQVPTSAPYGNPAPPSCEFKSTLLFIA